MTPANDNFPRVIALAGAAGSGKSTVADHLVDLHGYTRVKFAGPLKDMCRAIGLTDEHIEGGLKEVPADILQGKSPRQFMQALGTEFGRDMIGENFWVGLWEARAAQHDRVVVDDCRFPNEAAAVRRLGGVVIKLEGRGGIGFGHASERFDFIADAVIQNDGGIRDLISSVVEALAA
ncbi:deoxynucleotide monophosphate kinase [Limoniibacter endophyticus]|uniref:Deoxynucleotide monophosphate kinase n=1 Tax=Limoniibacter endophyticus TaxID=1565040 RepID=A0A8J3DNX1_9HYPH|nr:deoxynucleotide monophosphate kinase [Limoniibacter endophyticus]GHC61771.1 hypothetical protein GCM10010136_02530 [Limoniibacter endophyticus]